MRAVGGWIGGGVGQRHRHSASLRKTRITVRGVPPGGIVEDNPQNLKLVRHSLQIKGYQTIEAGPAKRVYALRTSDILRSS